MKPPDDDTTFYTATMARIHRQQGRYDRAAKIYRHLLTRDGDNAEIQAALEEADALGRLQASDRLKAAVARWIDLVLTQRRLADLNRLPRKEDEGTHP